MPNSNYLHAELALASYGDFRSPTPPTGVLIDAGLAEAQAELFASKWLVVTQYTPY